MNLFNLDSFGVAEGTTVKDLPAFVNWILSCEESVLQTFEIGGENLTKLVSGDSLLLDINPITAWVEEKLEYSEKSREPVGNTKSNTLTLYGNYLEWCKINNVVPVKIHSFSESLIDKLKTSFKWYNVEKKRTASGINITGIKFKLNKNLTIKELKSDSGTYN